MKKIFFCSILFAIPFLALAQGVRFIVFADPQITWLQPESRIAENAGVRGGIDAGFAMDNFFSTNYAFSTGVSLNNISGKLRFNDFIPFQFENFSDSLAPGNVVTYKLQYINIPLGLKFTTREIGYTSIYARLGFGGHFNIRSRADINSLGIENEGLRDEINLFSFSYHFGTGIHYSLGGQTAVVAGFEYRHRFIDVAASDLYKTLLNSVSLKIGLLF